MDIPDDKTFYTLEMRKKILLKEKKKDSLNSNIDREIQELDKIINFTKYVLDEFPNELKDEYRIKHKIHKTMGEVIYKYEQLASKEYKIDISFIKSRKRYMFFEPQKYLKGKWQELPRIKIELKALEEILKKAEEVEELHMKHHVIKDIGGSNNHSFRKNASINIFFELDFYVPKIDRKNKGLKANPYKKDHFLVGGTFIRTFPILKSEPEKNSFWIWDYENSEKLLLENIYKYFIDSWEILQKNDNYNDLTFCGVGISRIDLPYLLAKCINYKIDNEINIFNYIQKSRVLDLENVTIPHFNTIDNYIYSKTKGEIYKLFLDTIPTSSTIIWERFDNNNYEEIKKNNEKNVSELIDIYKILLKCGIIKRMRKIYKKETFEKLLEFIEDEDDKIIIENNFLYNETEEKYCLNEYELDMNMHKNFIHNVKLKMKINKIMGKAYKLYKQSENQ